MRRSLVSIGILCLIGTGFAYSHEERVSVDKVPKPVMDAVKARFKEAQVTGAGKETEEGKPVYEITLKVKGQDIDVTLTPQGQTLLVEKAIPRESLPKAVSSTLETKYPQATYKIVEEITKVEKNQDRLAYYEVLLVTPDGKKLEAQVTPEGKITNEEKKGAGEDEEEDEE
jgi:uncharacterized membrane protein YkoI